MHVCNYSGNKRPDIQYLCTIQQAFLTASCDCNYDYKADQAYLENTHFDDMQTANVVAVTSDMTQS